MAGRFDADRGSGGGHDWDDAEWNDENRDAPQESDLDDESDSTDAVPCPNCGALLADFADLCPKCGEFVVHGRSEPRSRSRATLILILIGALVLLLVFGSL